MSHLGLETCLGACGQLSQDSALWRSEPITTVLPFHPDSFRKGNVVRLIDNRIQEMIRSSEGASTCHYLPCSSSCSRIVSCKQIRSVL